MNYVFANPDKVMVGVRGEVGSRLFLLQAREGRRLVIVKCEKQQLAALAEWLAQVITEMGRPGHLPDDLSLEAEYETDFVAGDIAVSLDEEAHTIEVTFESLEGEDETGADLDARVGRRPGDRHRATGGGRSTGVSALRRSARSQGHDCPRTNGHTPPIR